MPNWCGGNVSVTGTKPNVINFVNRFIHDEDIVSGIHEGRCFARSFTNDSRQTALDDIAKVFDGMPDNTEHEFDFFVNFAWNAHYCIIDGYYIACDPDNCITLDAACVEDQVSVDILTEECSEGFEEHITCDKTGRLISENKDLLSYMCMDCGAEMSISSFTNPDEYECCECGGSELESID